MNYKIKWETSKLKEMEDRYDALIDARRDALAMLAELVNDPSLVDETIDYDDGTDLSNQIRKLYQVSYEMGQLLKEISAKADEIKVLKERE